MEVEVLKSDKNEIEVKLNDLTIAEILRVYLNAQGAEFAAWRREHPSKPAIMRIVSSGKTAKKAISEAVEAIKKDCDAVLKVVKK